MPQFTHRDRMMVEAENALWSTREQLREALQWSGAWSERVAKVVAEIGRIAIEMRDYNDQFETDGSD